MSGRMNKPTKIILALLAVIAMIAVCFTCVGIYAKKEFSKPVFTLPDLPELSSVTALPTDAAQAAEYIQRLYDAATAADDVEASWYTDVDLGGNMSSPFAESDQAVVDFIRGQAGGQIAALYPAVSDVNMTNAENIPSLPLPAAVLEMDAVQRSENESGSDEFYYITLQIDPSSVDVQAMLQSDVYNQIEKILKPAASIERAEIAVQSVTLNAKIDRLTDHLISVDVSRECQIHTLLTLTDTFASLSSEKTAKVDLPYATTEHIRFSYYGVHFTQRAMAVKPGDMKALPVTVTVSAQTTANDYSVSYDVSQPETMKIDADGVMTVEQVSDDPVTITMTLEYDGHVYSDAMTVYITDMEVKSDV